MANPAHRRAIQHAHSSNNITFGHFGTASYDTDTSRWSFTRQPLSSTSDKNVNDGSFLKMVKPPVKIIEKDSTTSSPRNFLRKPTIPDLSKTFPTIAGVDNQIVSKAYSHQSPPRPEDKELSLLAFGDALILGGDDLQSGLQTTPVAAFVSRHDKTKLVLMLLDRQTIRVDMGDPVLACFPCISERDTTRWLSSQGPILQLCFSDRSSSQEASWLAVRQTTGTTLCQPLFHRSTKISNHQSALDPNVVTEIPVSRTGDLQHADVAFHPRDPRQVAIVDVGGNWSIWSVRGSRSRSARILYRIELIANGSFVIQPEKFQQFDGWHRIVWLSSAGSEIDCILFANRQSIALFDLEGLLLSDLDVRVGSRGEGSLLDVLLAPSLNEFFILTATHIFCMATTSIGMGSHLNDNSQDLMVLASWRHFRGITNNTFRMSCLRSTRNVPQQDYGDIVAETHVGVWLIIHSEFDSALTAYHFSRTAKHHYQTIVSDAVVVDTLDEATEKFTHLSMHAVAAEYYYGKSSLHGFFKMFLQHADGGIYEALYHHGDLEPAVAVDENAIPLPKKHVLQHTSAYRITANDLEGDFDGFIVDDDYYNDEEDPDFLEPLSTSQNAGQSRQVSGDTLRTCDLQLTHRILRDTSFPSNDPGDVEDALSEVSHNIDQSPVVQTLWQYLGSQERGINLSDIDAVSSRLDTWLQDLRDTGMYDVIETGLQEPTSLIDIYNKLADQWLTTLSETIPDRSRVHRERLLRRIALETYSSSVLISPRLSADSQNSVKPTSGTISSSLTMPAQSWLPSDPSLPTSPTIASSQTLVQPNERSSILSKYLKFNPPKPTNENQSTILQDILAHLPTSIDTDPNDYNFNKIELGIARTATEQANQNLNPRARRRLEKQRRVREHKLKSQAEISRTAAETSIVLPPVISSQLPIRGVQSSQTRLAAGSSQTNVEALTQLNMTQPERGAYGGKDMRKDKAKNKGGRKKGF